ncbi:hypothetical protein [Umezawaea sp.]|uniref:hypothetical protein n=1 Tax=Umezawaea sp. TaxID=1955258 RepID=UPI002ECFADC8
MLDSRWEGTRHAAALGSRKPFVDGEPVEVRGPRGIAGDHGLAAQVDPGGSASSPWRARPT